MLDPEYLTEKDRIATERREYIDAQAAARKPEEDRVGNQLTDAEYAALTRAERRQARNDGRTNQITGAPVDPGGNLTLDQYSAMNRADRRRAREQGRVDHLTTNPKN